MMWRPTRRDGRSARVNACGSMCCSTLDSGAAMPCGLGARMFVMAWRRSRPKRAASRVTVTLSILPALAETLKVGPCGDLTFIAGANGRPLTKESFGNEFREACRLACVPGSAHGVRKIAATRAANAGAIVAQLEAIFGWQGGAMASRYTREADRRRLALEAMHTLENEKRTSIVAPKRKVRHSEPKDQSKQQCFSEVVRSRGLEPVLLRGGSDKSAERQPIAGE